MTFWLIIAGLCAVAIGVIAWPFRGALIHAPQRKSNFIVLGIIALLPTVTLLLYSHWGASQLIDQAAGVQQRVAAVKDTIQREGSHQKLITEFEQHLRQHPDAKGLILLAKLYRHDGRVEDAIKALEQANKLQQDDPEILFGLAEALFVAHNDTLNDQAQSLLQAVIKQNPDATAALTLLGIDSYNKGQYNQALSYFERLLPYYSPETEEGKRLLDIIARAQKLRG